MPFERVKLPFPKTLIARNPARRLFHRTSNKPTAHPLPFSSPGEQAHLFEHPQVFGNGRWGNIKRSREILDQGLLFCQMR